MSERSPLEGVSSTDKQPACASRENQGSTLHERSAAIDKGNRGFAMSVELFGRFLERQLTVTPATFQVARGDPMEVVELLWVFMGPLSVEPASSFVDSAPYDPAGEAEFDFMLESLAYDPGFAFTNRHDATLTVWKERLFQAITVLGANAAEGRRVILPPRELDTPLRQVAAACLWLHKMELPFAPGTVRPLSPPGRA